MDAKHTPGPWKVEADMIDDDESPDYLRITAPGADVASGILIDADARLIAAAPEMLDVLNWAVRFIEIYAREESGPATPELNKARAAIAKAKGA